MTTNNEAMKALEAFERWIDSAGCLEQKHFDNGDIRTELARNAKTIRTALKKSAQVDGLVKALEYEVTLGDMHLEMIKARARGDYLDKKPIVNSIKDRKNRIEKALQQFSAKEKSK